jgi:hypothetical protein
MNITLTLLGGVNAVCVDVVQNHVKSFRHSITELYFKKRQILEWYLSCPKQLHRS